MHEAPPTVFRPGLASRASNVALLLVLDAAILWLIVGYVRAAEAVWHVLMAAFFALVALGLSLQVIEWLRCFVAIDDDGITFRNLLRVHRVGWDQVAEVSRQSFGAMTTLSLSTVNRRKIRISALTRPNPFDARRVREAYSRLEGACRRRQIPAPPLVT